MHLKSILAISIYTLLFWSCSLDLRYSQSINLLNKTIIMDSLAKMNEIENDITIEVNAEEVKNTPFVIITRDHKNHEDEIVKREFFGAMGQNRLTDVYGGTNPDEIGQAYKECKADIEAITWDRIMNVIFISMDYKKEIENAKKDVD